jgi:hypothetical protein
MWRGTPKQDPQVWETRGEGVCRDPYQHREGGDMADTNQWTMQDKQQQHFSLGYGDRQAFIPAGQKLAAPRNSALQITCTADRPGLTRSGKAAVVSVRVTEQGKLNGPISPSFPKQ